MHHGTKVVPNDVKGEYDVRWSIMLKLGLWVGGIMATLVAASVLASAGLALATVRKLDVIEERMHVSIQNQAEFKEDIRQIKVQIATEDYVTKTEFTRWIGAVKATR